MARNLGDVFLRCILIEIINFATWYVIVGKSTNLITDLDSQKKGKMSKMITASFLG